MPLTLKIYSRARGRKKLIDERVLKEDRITVGRGAACTVILEDPNKYLSRLHAEFERTPRGYLLRVTSGSAPVVVNGVSHFQGSEVTVHAGDVFAMEGYELEVASVAPTQAPVAGAAPVAARPSSAPASPPPPKRLAGPVHVNVQSPRPGINKKKWLAIGAAAIVSALVLGLSWTAIRDSAEQRKAEQSVARLEGEARSLLKLVDSDRREIREATAAASREIERVEGLVRAARTSQDRAALDAAMDQARRMARASFALENKVRERVEGPSGLPKAEGTLGAAAAAAKGGDRMEAIKLLEATVASLAQMRLKIAEDRKATQAELEKRREELLAAESRAMAEAEVRAKVEAEARARAKAKADAEAEHTQTEQVTQSAHSMSACIGRLAGTWSHPAGGTWTFAGNQGTRAAAAPKHGPKARQITVMNISSCGNDTLTYKFARLALVDTDDPGQAYDRTEANTPNLAIWAAKPGTLRYSISKAGLRIGNYTYAKR
jgi:pSer/pThr/pTyr-binding forkhead associated (FHA) protein